MTNEVVAGDVFVGPIGSGPAEWQSVGYLDGVVDVEPLVDDAVRVLWSGRTHPILWPSSMTIRLQPTHRNAQAIARVFGIPARLLRPGETLARSAMHAAYRVKTRRRNRRRSR